jgi:hypothetical protein
MIGATESTASFSKRRSSPIGSVSVTTTRSIGARVRFSTALPENRPCVATAQIAVAPRLRSRSAAAEIVPPVAIMSSTMTQVRPSTSPTTSSISTAWARSRLRFLWRKAIGAWSRWPYFSAIRTRPESGETTVRSPSTLRPT